MDLRAKINFAADAILKFQGEQHSEWHPGALVWPGIDGIPMLKEEGMGDAPMDPRRLFMFMDFRARIFDLNQEADHKYYTWVCDRIIGGWFIMHFRESLGQGKVYLEWVQRYLKLRPGERLAAVNTPHKQRPLDILQF